uniref:Clathrin heavy chain linker core motif domain-containing protein n=1 Tax=Lactuca sativa TaxID=4236 RepID=A0A9R1XM67_LACSA|nr:hypothetical protein LSAT_V11C300151460 [Lactuca sativa]
MLPTHLFRLLTCLGLLFVYDLETATTVYKNRISPYPIFLTSEASLVGGFYAANRHGQVLVATVNEATIVPFVSGQLNNLELAVNLAKRGNLSGAENLVGHYIKIKHKCTFHMNDQVVQRFQELFAQTKYKEVVELAAKSPQGIFRTPEIVAKFQSVPVQGGQTPPLLQYFGTLLTKGKLDAFESVDYLAWLSIRTKRIFWRIGWLKTSWNLSSSSKSVDNDLALKFYIKASATPKVVADFAERREFDRILIYSKQIKITAELMQVGYTPDYLFLLQIILRSDP